MSTFLFWIGKEKCKINGRKQQKNIHKNWTNISLTIGFTTFTKKNRKKTLTELDQLDQLPSFIHQTNFQGNQSTDDIHQLYS